MPSSAENAEINYKNGEKRMNTACVEQIREIMKEYHEKMYGKKQMGLSWVGEADFENYVDKVHAILNFVEVDETPMVMCDTTITSNCTKGFFLTNKRFYNLKERTSIELSDLTGIDCSKAMHLKFVCADGQVSLVSCVTVDVANKKRFAATIQDVIKRLCEEKEKTSVEATFEETASEETTVEESTTSSLNFCPNCGTRVEAGNLFCVNCGYKF